MVSKGLICKYCGTVMKEGHHSSCEHSNSSYEEMEVKQNGKKNIINLQ